MPPLRRWVQFLGSAGGIVGLGVLFVKFGTPDDDQFLREISPELRAQYMKEKEIRAKADVILQRKIEETRDKPAWLQGYGAMRKLDKQITEEARKAVEGDEQQRLLDNERQRLRELAEREKKL